MSVTIRDRHELATGLAAVLPHAGRDDTLPVLSTVLMHLDGGYLYLTATDRYSAAQYQVEVDPDIEGQEFGPVIVPLDVAREISRMAKSRKVRTPQAATLNVYNITGPANRYTHNKLDIILTGADESKRTFTLDTLDMKYPQLSAIVGQPEGRDEQDQPTGLPATPSLDAAIGLAPEILAKFVHAAGQHRPVRLWFYGPRRIVHIRVGENFRAIVMPARLEGEPDFPNDAWNITNATQLPGEATTEQANAPVT